LSLWRKEKADSQEGMNRVFMDTSAIVAFFDRKDFNYADAKRTFEKIYINRYK
jgi:hypothetical protein